MKKNLFFCGLGCVAVVFCALLITMGCQQPTDDGDGVPGATTIQEIMSLFDGDQSKVKLVEDLELELDEGFEVPDAKELIIETGKKLTIKPQAQTPSQSVRTPEAGKMTVTGTLTLRGGGSVLVETGATLSLAGKLDIGSDATVTVKGTLAAGDAATVTTANKGITVDGGTVTGVAALSNIQDKTETANGVTKLTSTDQATNAATLTGLIGAVGNKALTVDLNGKVAITSPLVINQPGTGTITIKDTAATKGEQTAGIAIYGETTSNTVTRSLVIDGLKFAIADKEKLIPGENDEYYAIFYSAAGSLTVKNNTEVKITSEVAAGEDPEESILGIGTSTNPTAITVQNTTVEIAATGVDSDAGGACGIWLDAPTISLSSVTVDTSAATFEDSNNDSGIGINLNRVENLANVSVSGLTITVNTGRPSVEVTNAAAESGKVFGATMPEDDAVFTPSATSFNGQTVLDLFNAIVGQQPGVGYILRFWEGVQGPAGKHALKNTAEGWIHNPVS